MSGKSVKLRFEERKMKSNAETQQRRSRYKFSAWHLIFPCVLCLSVSLWLVTRPHIKVKPEGDILRAANNQALQQSPARATPPSTRVLTPSLSASSARSLSSEKFRARFSARVERREVESVLRTLEKVRRDVARRTAAASLPEKNSAPLDVVIHDTTGDFVAATGQPWWAAAVTHDNLIELQPLEILRSRGVLEQTLRHEYAHTVIENLSGGNAPRWLSEGLAAHVAGEGALLAYKQSKEQLSVEELEKRLAQPASAEEMHELYAAAYREVSALIRTEGEAEVWRRLLQN
jgi:hypothetical protein